ncbi:hypothetical protein WB401_34270 [Streptomyces brasiliscabiei]|uniref:Secreted protein n=1 Tax=Streptomyces brasiliscabiei TaxID=2736302 RepID=A0ABU8GRX8_9ACTN
MIRGPHLAVWSALTTAVLLFCTAQTPAVGAARTAEAVLSRLDDGVTGPDP